MFTLDNTEGYSQAQLNILNQFMNEWLDEQCQENPHIERAELEKRFSDDFTNDKILIEGVNA